MNAGEVTIIPWRASSRILGSRTKGLGSDAAATVSCTRWGGKKRTCTSSTGCKRRIGCVVKESLSLSFSFSMTRSQEKERQKETRAQKRREEAI